MATADTNSQADTIDFAAGVTVINLVSGQIVMTTDTNGLVINGTGVTINGAATASATNRIFSFNVGAGNPTFTINDLTLAKGNLTSGNNGGAMLIANDPVVLNNVALTNNTTASAGGAIAAATAGNLTLTNCTLTLNSAGTTGGAVHAATSTGTTQKFTNCSFSNNTATSFGGAIHTSGSGGSVTITTCNILNNTSSADGGGLSIGSGSYWTISQCQFTGNQAANGGGVRFATQPLVMSFDRCLFSTNSATSAGGGLFWNAQGSIVIQYSTFAGNVAGTEGGAIAIPIASQLVMHSSTLSGNEANGAKGGGALFVNTSIKVTIAASTIVNNQATHATGVGGGISWNNPGPLNLNSTIIAKNTATGVGGDDLHLTSTLFSSPVVVTGGNNLIGDVTAGNFALSGMNITGVDPLLGPLQDNGGGLLTHALLPGSPAFNTGNNASLLSTDQRGAGFPRVVTGVADIGAVEGLSPIPAAFGFAPNVPPFPPTYTVTVNYYDEMGIDTATIDVNDIQVTAPNFPTLAAPTSVSITGSGTLVTAKYVFNSPSPSWTWLHNGFYRIEVQPNQVFDTDGPAAVPAGAVGTFRVAFELPPLVVDNIGDNDDGQYGPGQLTLREAINLANFITGKTETISFAGSLTGSTIALGSPLKITDPLQITGPGAANLTISGSKMSRIFEVDFPAPGYKLELSGLTLANAVAANGFGGALVNLTPATITVNNSVFTDNSAYTGGGAIGLYGQTSLTLGNCTLTNNNTQSGGGAINASGNATVTINNSQLTNNSAQTAGGAIGVYSAQVILINSALTGNSSKTYGGAVAAGWTSTITLNQATLSNNSASRDGGAIYAERDATITVTDSTLNNNTATWTGGALQTASLSIANITITNSTLSGNSSQITGGAIHTSYTTNLNVTGTTIGSNTATSNGGAIFVNATSTVTLNSSTITANVAKSSGAALHILGNGSNSITLCVITNNVGGGIRVPGNSGVTVDQSTISGNTGTNAGGGIDLNGKSMVAISNSTIANNVASAGGGFRCNNSATITITNTTISGNKSSDSGGLLLSSGLVTINNSTIVDNQALGSSSFGAGGVFVGSASVTLNSTIVANNVAGGMGAPDFNAFSKVTIGGGLNLVGNVSKGNFTLSGTNVTGVDPLLGPLQNNGGPTDTHALLPGSPSISAGNNLPGSMFDQRGAGFPRVRNDFVDVGAVEFVSVIPTAKASAANVPPILTTVPVQVTYSDETAIDTTTIDVNDVLLSGPGYPMPIAPASAFFMGSGQSVVATYEFATPLGGWHWSHFGTYTITMQADQVRDTDGPNFVFPGPIGNFQVAIPFPQLIVDNTSDIDDGNFGPGQFSLREALRLANSFAATTDTIGFSNSIAGQTIALSAPLSITDPVQIVGLGADQLTVSGSGSVRIFDVNIPSAAAPVTISGLTLTDAKADFASAIYVLDEVISVTGCVFRNNVATQASGTILILNAGSLIVDDCWFDANQNGYAAIAFQSGGGLRVTDSLFTNNKGSGIYGSGPVGSLGFNIENSTFVGNAAYSQGGAVNLESTFQGVAHIRNCTIVGNTADFDGSLTMAGGGVGTFPGLAGTIHLESCIIYGNTSGTSATPSDLGTLGIVTAKSCLIGTLAGTTQVTPDATTTALLGKNPMLEPLANNGGPTPTMKLMPGSPAINMGSNPSGLLYDQRGIGYARNSGGAVDIGAFEVQAPPPQVTSILVNDGASQRSLVKSITVQFDNSIILSAGAFVLTRTANGTAGTIGIVATPMGNNAVLTFDNSGSITLDPGGSLPDGTYELTIVADNVTGTTGTLDGNKNGISEGSPVDNVTSKLHRLFGDANGDGSVTAADFNAFRLDYGLVGASIFDFDNSGSITAADFNTFRLRYGLSGYAP